jgi:hypothetical protein
MSQSNAQGLPNQKIPYSKKTESWQQECIDYYIERVGVGGQDGMRNKYERMNIAYGLYDSEFDKSDFKYVTDPYDVGDTFPANIQNYNIIRPKVDLLVGEESKRPDDFRVIQTNYDVVSTVQEEYKSTLMQAINAELKGEEYPVTLQDIQKYMKYDYKTIAEEVGYNLLKHLKERLNTKNEFLKGWFDAQAARMEIYYTGAINGEPVVERVDPRDCDFDIDATTDFIDQKNWFRRSFYMSPYALYDRLRDLLDEKDLDKMLNMISQGGTTSAQSRLSAGRADGGIRWSENLGNRFMGGGGHRDTPTEELYCAHVVWRSYTRIGFLTVPKEDGTIDTVVVDETYVAMPDDIIEWEWVIEVWEGYKIGEDLYKARPIPYQHRSLETINDNRLPYTGVVYNATNAYGKSLIEVMKPLQYMYMVIWYRIELAIAKDKGSILNMDITQIPKKYGIDIDKWLHYLNALGINFINPYEEGWDVPGREGGKMAPFNQISAQNLSTIQTIDSYIQLLEKIETMIGEVVGITKQREGSIATRELVGNVERAVQQSSHITEPLFWLHNQCKRRVYNLLMNVAQHQYSNTDKRKLQFILSDGARKFLDISDDFIYADLDIFVSDSTKDSMNIEALKSLLQPAMQNGATILDAAEIITADNMSVIKGKLKDIEERRMQMVQQQQQQESMMAEQEMMLEQQKNDADYELKSEELRIKEEDSIRKAEVTLEVAMIGAENKGEATPEDNSFAESLEKQKMRLEETKVRRDAELKERAQRETERKNKMQEKQKETELSIRRIQARKKPTTSKK